MDRHLQFKIKAVADSGEIEGYVSVYGNKDLNGDIIEPGAMTKTLQETGGQVVLLFHHDRTRPIGTAYLTEDAKGIKLLGRIEIDLPDGKLAYEQAKRGMLKGLSIGYRTVKEVWDDIVKAYRILELKLFEASMVTIPANPLTLITGVKSEHAEVIARAYDEIKAGKVLSKATRTRLAAINAEIQALLAEADASDEAADEGKTLAPTEPLMHSLSGLTAILRAQ